MDPITDPELGPCRHAHKYDRSRTYVNTPAEVSSAGYLTNAEHMCTLGRMSEPATMLTPPEAAKRLGVHHQTLRRWMKAGTVASVEMPSGRKKVPASEVDRILLGRAS